jgi:hypothetical protein
VESIHGKSGSRRYAFRCLHQLQIQADKGQDFGKRREQNGKPGQIRVVDDPECQKGKKFVYFYSACGVAILEFLSL